MKPTPLLLAAALLLGRAAAAQILDPGTLGGDFAAAYGVNRPGVLVGVSHDLLGDPTPFRTDAGSPLALPGLGGIGGAARAVADSGWVAGSAATTTGELHACLWDAVGSPLDLGTLGGPTSAAWAVDEAGRVAGGSLDALGDARAFVWDALGGMVDLGTLGGLSSEARGIDDDGAVVGWSEDALGDRRAFLWTTAGGMLDLLADPGMAHAARGGFVVGQYTDSLGLTRAFAYDRATGALFDPGGLGGDETIAWAVDGGALAGSSRDALGERRAFLAALTGTALDLNVLLDADAAGWRLTDAFGLRRLDDGAFLVVGAGLHDGAERAFVARVTLTGGGPTAAPEPAAHTLFLLALLALPRRRSGAPTRRKGNSHA